MSYSSTCHLWEHAEHEVKLCYLNFSTIIIYFVYLVRLVVRSGGNILGICVAKLNGGSQIGHGKDKYDTSGDVTRHYFALDAH